VEQANLDLTFNQVVVGSIPTGLTTVVGFQALIVPYLTPTEL
jgi:predicted RND superfamily exporter protein